MRLPLCIKVSILKLGWVTLIEGNTKDWLFILQQLLERIQKFERVTCICWVKARHGDDKEKQALCSKPCPIGKLKVTSCHIRRNRACTMNGLSLRRQKFSQEKDSLNNKTHLLIPGKFLDRGEGWEVTQRRSLRCATQEWGSRKVQTSMKAKHHSESLFGGEANAWVPTTFLLARDRGTQTQREKVRHRTHCYFYDNKMS